MKPIILAGGPGIRVSLGSQIKPKHNHLLCAKT
jgi:hypothetical protein